MTDIGVLPTKTSLQIKSSSGADGTIPAATEGNAGCMTAEHVKMLKAVYEALMRGGIDPVTIIAPSVDTSNMVSRAELQAVINRLQATPAQVVAPDNAGQIPDMTGPVRTRDARQIVRRTEAPAPVVREPAPVRVVEHVQPEPLQSAPQPARVRAEPIDFEAEREAAIAGIAAFTEANKHLVPEHQRDVFVRAMAGFAADAKAATTLTGIEASRQRAEAYITAGAA